MSSFLLRIVIFPKPIFVKLAEQFRTLHFKCVTFGGPWFAGKDTLTPPKVRPNGNSAQRTDELYEQVYGRKPDLNKRTTDPIN